MKGSQLFNLPDELLLDICLYCSPTTLVNSISLTSKSLNVLVCDNGLWRELGLLTEEYKNREQSHGVFYKIFLTKAFAIVESCLHLNEVGRVVYNELKKIDQLKSNSDKQAHFEAKAKISTTYAWLILYHSQFWRFIDTEAEKARFVEKVAGAWPEVLLYSLQQLDLRKQLLRHPAALDNLAQFITRLADLGSDKVAFYILRTPELMEAITQLRYEWTKINYIIALVEVVGSQAALYVLQKTELIRLIMQLKHERHRAHYIIALVKEGGSQAALYVLRASELIALITQLRYTWTLAHCVFDLIKVGASLVAFYEDPTLIDLITQLSHQWIQAQCIITLVRAGGSQVALYVLREPILTSLIAQFRNPKYRTDCFTCLMEVGGDAVRKLYLENPNLALGSTSTLSYSV